MTRKSLYTKGALVGVLALALLGIPLFSQKPADAQVPSANPPFNVDLGALITNTARTAGTVNSAQQSNLDKTGVACTFNITAQVGTPNALIAIQNFDTASGLYYTIATSSASSPQPNVPIVVIAHDGAQITSLPAGVAAAAAIPLARFWRVQQVIGGATSVTGTVGCVALK